MRSSINIFDIHIKLTYLLWGLATGICLFSAGYSDIHIQYKEAWIKYLTNFKVSDSYLEVISGIIITIYALALPLSIFTISEQLKPYKDDDLIFWISNRWEVFFIRICLPLLLVYIIILSFLDIHKGLSMIIVTLFSCYSLIITYRFFKLISQLLFNTEQMIIQWSSEIAKSKIT